MFDPSKQDQWFVLQNYIESLNWRTEDGRQLEVDFVGIDRGYLPDRVLGFLASTKKPLKWFAVKGSTSTNLIKDFINMPAIDKNYGCRVIEFGTHMGKDRLLSHYNIDMPGPGFVNIPETMVDAMKISKNPNYFLKLMLAESRREAIVGGRRVNKWLPKRQSLPCEIFDCMVYTLGMALTLDKYMNLGLSSMHEGSTFVPKAILTTGDDGSTVIRQDTESMVEKPVVTTNPNGFNLDQILNRMAGEAA